ncbi:hypothetical protein PBMB05447_17615 [Bacillus thuringiensis F14-1]|nr:hypothetical protein PBMB05447_17295 [Bacillus thuringiensis F14-1]TEA82398.1 hypothetical protein PBMB05447_17615 [Bacillus thuringiensis F14-1]
MSNALQIKNDEAIVSHSERPQQTPQTPKNKLLTKYITHCVNGLELMVVTSLNYTFSVLFLHLLFYSQ